MTDKIVESFKEALEKVLDEAKACLITNDGIQGKFIVSENGKDIESINLTLKPDLKPEESMQMKIICKEPKVVAAAIIMDAYTLVVPDEEIEAVKKPLKDHPDRVEALLLYLYTRDKSFVRVLPYKKQGNRDYWFGDEGWTDVTESQGLFENVFKE